MVRTAAANVLKGLKKELDGLAIGGDAAATQTTGVPVSGVPAAKAEVLVSGAGTGAGRPLLGAKPPRALTDLPDEGGGALRYVHDALAIIHCACSLALSRVTPLTAWIIVPFSCPFALSRVISLTALLIIVLLSRVCALPGREAYDAIAAASDQANRVPPPPASPAAPSGPGPGPGPQRQRDPAIVNRAREAGVRLEKFENVGLEEQAVAELTRMVENSRQEGFLAYVKQVGGDC